MKILHINSDYHDNCFYEKLYDKQLEKGVDILNYVPKPKGRKQTTGNSYTIFDNCYYRTGRYLFILKHNKIFKSINKIIKKNDFDIIHSHFLFSNGYVALQIYRLYGIPYVVAVRNTDLNGYFKKEKKLYDCGIDILKNAKKVIFLSETYKEQIIECLASNLRSDIIDKSLVIPNGIDDFWLEKKNQHVKREGQIRVIQVGDVNKNKNILTTVAACNMLKQEGWDIRLQFAGKIIEKRLFNKIIRHEFTEYLGVLDRNKLLYAYRNNDFFVLPSYTETFGLVYAEAMSQGIPVIYSRGQGFDRQFPEGEVGYSVNPNDAGDIAKCILLCHTNYSKISDNCIKHIRKFDWSLIASKYIDIYNDIINSKK